MLSPFSLPGTAVRALTTADLPALQALLERCADFNLLVSGEPPQPGDAAELLAEHPPGRLPEDKIVFGVYDPGDALLGVLDLAWHYPRSGVWWIGLLLLDPASRGQGLGRQVYYAFEDWACRNGAEEIRLGVVERNEKALRFWERMGFQVIDKRPPVRMGVLEQVVVVMKKIPAGKAGIK